MNRILRYGPLIVPMIVVVGCGPRGGDAGDTADSSSPVVPVRVAPVGRADIERTITTTGRTEAVRQQKIYAPVAGTVLSCRAAVGQQVRVGEMLIEIRPKDSQMQIDGAESLLSSATTPQARAEAERMLALARSVDNVARVVTPIGGVVSARTVNAGEIVAEGADMLSIVDLSSIVFTADMPLSVMTDVRVGMRCRVRLQAMPDTLLDATLSAVSPQAESQSQSVPVRFEFRGLSPSVRADLKSDMNGTAIVVVGTDRHALVVPSAAVLRDDRDDSFTVVVVGSDSTARIVPVQVIARRDSVVEVRGDGLSEGVDVIVEGNYALPDSTRIRVVR